jgi:chemotaxis methyl-accepting protein methylase
MIARPDVEAFREAIGRSIGLRFEDDRLDRLEELLASRISAVRASNASEYIASFDARELAVLMRALSVNETYFFRSPSQFRVVEELIRRRAGRPSRMLSAGCASGE